MAEPKTVRKDSARNRERLVTAAREVFAERGFAATLDDIARHAGLGTGTAYRNFPNKQVLAAEILAAATAQIAVDAEQALAVPDPWQALVTFFELTGERQARERGLYEALTGLGDDEEQARIWPRIVAVVTQLFERAADAGVIRADARPQDIAAVFSLLRPAFEMSRATGVPDLWRRYLWLLLDGLRATGRPVLPVTAPPASALPQILGIGKPRA